MVEVLEVVLITKLQAASAAACRYNRHPARDMFSSNTKAALLEDRPRESSEVGIRLIQVLTDGSLVGSQQPRFEQGDYTVDPRQEFGGHLLFPSEDGDRAVRFLVELMHSGTEASGNQCLTCCRSCPSGSAEEFGPESGLALAFLDVGWTIRSVDDPTVISQSTFLQLR